MEKYYIVFFSYSHKNGHGSGETSISLKDKVYLNRRDVIITLLKSDDIIENATITNIIEIDKEQYIEWNR